MESNDINLKSLPSASTSSSNLESVTVSRKLESFGNEKSGSEKLSNHDSESFYNDVGAIQREFKETLLGSLCSARWTLSFGLFMANFILAALRINMSLAILCMVRKPEAEAKQSDRGNVSLALGNPSATWNSTGTLVTQSIPELLNAPWYIKNWTRQSQALILSAFFYGFLSTQIISGYVATKFGARKVLLAGNFLYGLTTLLIPFAARVQSNEEFQETSAYLVCALRVLCGMSAGVINPCFYYFWGRWLPPLERSKHVAFSLSGVMIGNVVILGSGGYICKLTHIDGGWPLIFYGCGAFSLITAVIFWFTLYDSPLTHPRISERERDYINQSLQSLENSEVNRRSLPLRKMLKSKAVWALLIVHFQYYFGESLMITKISALFDEVLGYDIHQNGLISTLPYVTMFVVSNSVARIIDRYRVKGSLSTVWARKISTTIAMGGSTVLLLIIVHLPTFRGLREVATTLMIVAIGLMSLTRTGFMANYVDIAPKYAGEFYAIANTICSLPGTFTPSIANHLTPTGSIKEWRNVFYLWSGMFVLGFGSYCFLAEGEEQDWAKDVPPLVNSNRGELKISHHKTAKRILSS